MTKDFIFRFFDVIDRFRSWEFAEYFSDDAVWNYANNSPIVGRRQIRDQAELIFSQVHGIGHQLVSYNATGHNLYIEGRVTYLRKDGRKIELPFSSVTVFNDNGLIQNYRTYLDPTPLYESAPLFAIN